MKLNRRQLHALLVDRLVDGSNTPAALAARAFEITGHSRLTPEAIVDLAATLAVDPDFKILLNGLAKQIPEMK